MSNLNVRRQRGTISVLTVIVVFMLVSLGAVMLSLSNTHSKSTSGHQLRLRTLLIASAGVHAAVAELNSEVDPNGDGPGTLPLTSFDSGSYQVSATFDATNDEYTIVSVGRFAGITRTLEVVVMRPWYPIFRFGMFGDRSMTVLDGTLTDSINSSLGPVESQSPTQEGDVGSNGLVDVQPGATATINGDLFSSAVHRDLIPNENTTVIQTAGSLRISGDVRTGYGGVQLSGDTVVQGNITTGEGTINAGGATVGGLTDSNGPPVPDLDFTEVMQGVEAAKAAYGGGQFNDAPLTSPALPSGGARVTVAAGDTLTLTAGHYSYGQIDVRGTLIVTGDASIGVSGKFIIREGASVQFKGSMQLDASQVLMYGTTSSLVAAKKTTIRAIGSMPKLRLAGNLTFNDEITLASKGDIIGMDLAGMTMEKKATFVAEGMMEFKSGANYTFKDEAWIDARGSIVVKEGATIDFLGKTVIDADTVDIRETSVVNFAGDDTRVFAKQQLEIKGDTTLTAIKPTSLWWYAWGDNPQVALKEFGKFYGGLAVPNGEVDIKMGMEIYGAVLARDVIFRQNAKLHYDLAFGNMSDRRDLKYRVISWRETGN